MPLHDWSERRGWEGMHHFWIAELSRWIRPRLPAGYRTYIGSAPMLAVGAPSGKPDVGVWYPTDPARGGEPGTTPVGTEAVVAFEPDSEVAVAAIDRAPTLLVERGGRLVAAVELISPRNKDRPAARDAYLSRYLGYLLEAVHLLVVDVHPRPYGFSFADGIHEELGVEQPPTPPPFAVSYRVGEPAPDGGHFLAIWRRELAVGRALPTLPLPLSVEELVAIDLEATYNGAAADAYLD